MHPALPLPGYCMTDLIEPRMKSGGQRYAAVAAREGIAMEKLAMEGLLSPAVTPPPA